MKSENDFLTKISNIDSNLKNNKLGFNSHMQNEPAKKSYYCDKSAIEDYKNMKSEINDFNFEISPQKLAYQELRIRNFHNK
ncbi:MAG: hypothetical protein PHC34_04115 [Candidatus Gastranaerophilales bacterium]|nr:hypothetical protein [Candidatus Gastranaerophilales bacterium]